MPTSDCVGVSTLIIGLSTGSVAIKVITSR